MMDEFLVRRGGWRTGEHKTDVGGGAGMRPSCGKVENGRT